MSKLQHHDTETPFAQTTKKAMRAYRPPQGHVVYVTGTNFGWGIGDTGAEALANARNPDGFRAWVIKGPRKLIKADPFTGTPICYGDTVLYRLAEKLPRRLRDQHSAA